MNQPMKVFENLKLCLKEDKDHATVIDVAGVKIGNGFTMIAGPCSVESEEQMAKTVGPLKEMGVDIIRGGVFKARTSPYDFQGLGTEGLKILDNVRKEFSMPVITEVLDTRDVDVTSEYVDILQIGSRNMQNFALLKEVGLSDKPVLLKRGMSSTIEEWLNCAEYILEKGNPNVILCERGIRTFETFTRNTLDMAAVPAIKLLTHLPVFVDPSHGTGDPELIEPMSLSAVGAGADGLMIEVHHNPAEALSDKAQAIDPEKYSKIFTKVKKMSVFMKTNIK
ncbi:MAG: 3-deoxy-7-phosphoheptulonate synthase [Acidobacteriota bacterium]